MNHSHKHDLGPDDKKTNGGGNGGESPVDADNPVEPNDPGYPEGVSTVAGTEEEELKEDLI